MPPLDPLTWSPDPQTVQWCVGVMHEQDVKDSIREDVLRGGTEWGTDEFWLAVATAAVEAVAYDLGRKATEWRARVDAGGPGGENSTEGG